MWGGNESAVLPAEGCGRAGRVVLCSGSRHGMNIWRRPICIWEKNLSLGSAGANVCMA